MFRIKKAKSYVKATKLLKIARRYFVMNAFDGTLTMLGVLVGAYMSGNPQVSVIVSAGIAGSLAMGVSGMAGAYMTEKAERRIELKALEQAMLTELEDTFHGEASRFASVVMAVVDGLSPMLAAMLMLTPFILVNHGIIGIDTAFRAAIIIAGVELFGLGAYLAKISGENKVKYGLRMIEVGVITVLLGFFVGYLFGQSSN